MFAALLQRLVAQDKVAICRLIQRDEAAPRLVALLPQLERLDAKKVQVAPPGFHMIYLPFNDDLRKLKHVDGTPGTRLPSAYPPPRPAPLGSHKWLGRRAGGHKPCSRRARDQARAQGCRAAGVAQLFRSRLREPG